MLPYGNNFGIDAGKISGREHTVTVCPWFARINSSPSSSNRLNLCLLSRLTACTPAKMSQIFSSNWILLTVHSKFHNPKKSIAHQHSTRQVSWFKLGAIRRNNVQHKPSSLTSSTAVHHSINQSIKPWSSNANTSLISSTVWDLRGTLAKVWRLSLSRSQTRTYPSVLISRRSSAAMCRNTLVL